MGYGEVSSGYGRSGQPRKQRPRTVDWRANLAKFGRGKREIAGVELNMENIFQVY